MGKRAMSWYEVLGLSTHTPSADELRVAYKKAAIKFHPDRNSGNEVQAEKMFKDVVEAYTVLTDVEKKKKYDAMLQRQQILQHVAECPGCEKCHRVRERIRRGKEQQEREQRRLDVIEETRRRAASSKCGSAVSGATVGQKRGMPHAQSTPTHAETSGRSGAQWMSALSSSVIAPTVHVDAGWMSALRGDSKRTKTMDKDSCAESGFSSQQSEDRSLQGNSRNNSSTTLSLSEPETL